MRVSVSALIAFLRAEISSTHRLHAILITNHISSLLNEIFIALIVSRMPCYDRRTTPC